MSLIPCDSCTKRVPEKLCQATWAWYDAGAVRVAYRQRLCTQCYVTNVLPLDAPVNLDSLTCPACGISTDHDLDAIYITVYVPGQGREQFELPMCPACAPKVREVAQRGAVRLENRERVEGPGSGPSTQPTRDSYWSDLALRAQGDDE